MIFFELVLGLLILGLLLLGALFFAKGLGKRTKSTVTDPGIDSLKAMHEGADSQQDSDKIPRNKANMDQPQEEFIEPEGAHASPDDAKNRRGNRRQ